MNSSALRTTLVSLVPFLCGVVGVAAQDTSSDAPTQRAQPGFAVEEIIVTARLREEGIMDVPVVLSTHSREVLERYDTDSLQAIGELTPTVIVGAYKINGGGTIAIRGISTPANQVGFEQAVSVAIDGIQSSNGHISQLGFFDMARVEVLKGPQALFFGKNNTGGVISITSAGPTEEFEAGLRSGYEFEAGEFSTEGYISGPVSDTLGARLAVRYRNMNGWLTNTARPVDNPFYNPATGAPAAVAELPGTFDETPGEKELLGRLTLQFEPAPEFSATLRVLGGHSEDDGAGLSNQNIGPCAGPNPRVNGIPDPFGECVVDDRTTSGFIPPEMAATIEGAPADGSFFGDLDTVLVSLNMDYDFGDFVLTSLTGFSRMQYEYFTGGDQTTFTQLAVYEDQVQRDFSQELRLQSDFDGPFNVVVGAFYQDSRITVDANTKVNDGHYNAAADRYSLFVSPTKQTGDTMSLFGQAMWEIADNVELAGGLRWTQEKKDFIKSNTYGFGPFNTSATIFPGETEANLLAGKFKDNNVSPEVTLTWRPDEINTIFAAFRTGFKSGGFGMTNPLQQATRIGDVDFESETARGFEIGNRSIMADGRVNLSAALFYYDFKNLQVNIYDPDRIAFTISNAGKVRQIGAEVEGNVLATENLSFHGALTYVNNEFKNFTGQCYSYTFPVGSTRDTAVPPPNCSFVNETSLTLQQVFDGRTPARSPEWAGNVGFVYDQPVGEYRIGLTGDANYRGSYYASDTLVEASRQDDFWLFNASASIGDADDDWKISLIGRNLANKFYVLYAVDRTGGAGNPGAIGEQRGVVSRGREVILQTQLRF